MASPDLSCENPARGFNAYFQNRSGVPVIVEEVELLVYNGDRLIDIRNAEIADIPESFILAVGGDSAAGFTHREFPAIYRAMPEPGKGRTFPSICRWCTARS